MKFSLFHLFLLSTFVGCVYYNTFYNANEYYRKAMKSTPPNKNDLEQSIQRCEKIVKYYPRSKYVPSAIFLMGKCFFYQKKYDYAERKFKELIKYYGKSKFIPDAYFMLGKTYFEQKKYKDAKDSYLMAKKISKRAKREEISYEILNCYFLAGDFLDAKEEANRYLRDFPKGKFKEQVLIIKGNALDSLKEFEKAIASYKLALKYTHQKFKVLMMIGNSLLAMEMYNDALSTFLSLKNFPDTLKEKVVLKTAECYRRLGNIEKAIDVLKDFEKSSPALYMLGTIYEEELDDLEQAREYYNKAKEISPTSEAGKKALERSARIGKLKEFQERVGISASYSQAKTDSIRRELAKTQFQLAELYLLDFKKPIRAIKEYEKVLDNFKEDSVYAPKACLAIASIFEKTQKDTQQACIFYEKVLNEFPKTIYAEESKIALKRLKSGEDNKK